MSWAQAVSAVRAAAGIAHGSRAFGGPMQVSLSITNRCNVICSHCFIRSPHLSRPLFRAERRARLGTEEPATETQNRDLASLDADPEQTRGLLSDLVRMGTRRIQFSGNGELFLHPQVLDFMARARTSGCFCVANTNGTRLDETAIEELVRIGFNELRVTTMAGTAEGYRRTHPGTSPDLFDRLETSLRQIAACKAARNRARPRVVLVCIVIGQNCEDLAAFAEFAIRVRADGVLFKPVDDFHDPGLSAVVPTPEQALSARSDLPAIAQRLGCAGVRHNIPHFLGVFGRQLDTAHLYRHIPCYYPWLGALIEADGSVYPCCRCPTPLGNLGRSTFREIWHSPEYESLRQECLNLARRKAPVRNCDCYSCVHHTANLRVYRALHPIGGRKQEIKALAREAGAGTDE